MGRQGGCWGLGRGWGWGRGRSGRRLGAEDDVGLVLCAWGDWKRRPRVLAARGARRRSVRGLGVVVDSGVDVASQREGREGDGRPRGRHLGGVLGTESVPRVPAPEFLVSSHAVVGIELHRRPLHETRAWGRVGTRHSCGQGAPHPGEHKAGKGDTAVSPPLTSVSGAWRGECDQNAGSIPPSPEASSKRSLASATGMPRTASSTGCVELGYRGSASPRRTALT